MSTKMSFEFLFFFKNTFGEVGAPFAQDDSFSFLIRFFNFSFLFTFHSIKRALTPVWKNTEKPLFSNEKVLF